MLDRLIVNWPLKLLSLAIAFGIWLTVTGEKRVVQDFPVPLDVRLPQNRVAVVDLPNTVTVRLRGPESVMRRLDPLPLAMSVDLGEIGVGEQDISLLEDHMTGVPRGVDVDFIDPDRLALRVETKIRKVVDVDPTFLGQLPDGFTAYGTRVQPQQVTVEGPPSAVEPLQVVRTNAIRLDQRRERFSVVVNAVPEGKYVRVADAGPIRVEVDVDSAPVERTFQGVPVRPRRPAQTAAIDPPTLDVVLSGPAALMDRLNRDRIRLLVATADLETRPEPYTLAVEVEFNDIPVEDTNRLTVKALSRREVEVRLTDRRSSE